MNLEDINLQSLDNLKTFSQAEKLGCNVSSYAEHVELYRADDHIVYLLLYQCVVKSKITLKMATMTVYDRTNDTGQDDYNIAHSI